MAVGVHRPVVIPLSVSLSTAIMNENTPAGPQMLHRKNVGWILQAGIQQCAAMGSR